MILPVLAHPPQFKRNFGSLGWGGMDGRVAWRTHQELSLCPLGLHIGRAAGHLPCSERKLYSSTCYDKRPIRMFQK